MNRMKKIGSLVLAALMTAGLAACSTGETTKWVAKFGEQTVPAGIYIEKLMSQYYTITDKLVADGQEMPKKPLKEQVDGVLASDAIVTAAREDLNRYIVVEQKFSELNLALTPEDQANADQNVDGFWPYVSSTYTANGISEDSYRLSSTNTAKMNVLFRSIYDEGGSEAVPESELKTLFESGYAKVLMINLQFSAETDETVKKEADQATRDYMEELFQKVKGGADMEDVYVEARKKAATDPEAFVAPDKGSSFTIVGQENSPYDPKVTEAVFSAKNGEPVKVETDTATYLFVRYNITENPDDFTSRKLSLLTALKNDAFEQKLTDWGKVLSGITYNEDAFKRYTPDKLKMGV